MTPTVAWVFYGGEVKRYVVPKFEQTWRMYRPRSIFEQNVYQSDIPAVLEPIVDRIVELQVHETVTLMYRGSIVARGACYREGSPGNSPQWQSVVDITFVPSEADAIEIVGIHLARLLDMEARNDVS